MLSKGDIICETRLLKIRLLLSELLFMQRQKIQRGESLAKANRPQHLQSAGIVTVPPLLTSVETRRAAFTFWPF